MTTVFWYGAIWVSLSACLFLIWALWVYSAPKPKPPVQISDWRSENPSDRYAKAADPFHYHAGPKGAKAGQMGRPQ